MCRWIFLTHSEFIWNISSSRNCFQVIWHETNNFYHPRQSMNMLHAAFKPRNFWGAQPFFFNLQSLPSYFPWTCQSPDLNAFFLDGENKVWKTSRNLSEAKDKEWTSQFWIETTKPLCLHPSNVYWVTNLCRILFRSLACVKNQNKRWFRLSWLERSSYFT